MHRPRARVAGPPRFGRLAESTWPQTEARNSARPQAGSGTALHGAFGFDRNLGVRRRQRTPQHPGLPVTLLLARNGDVVRADFLAEAGDLVGPERVGARH